MKWRGGLTVEEGAMMTTTESSNVPFRRRWRWRGRRRQWRRRRGGGDRHCDGDGNGDGDGDGNGDGNGNGVSGGSSCDDDGGNKEGNEDESKPGLGVPVYLVLDGSRFCISRTKNGDKNVCANQNGEGGGKWECENGDGWW
jgi:hypothetical protein